MAKRRKFKSKNNVSYTGPKSRKRSYNYSTSGPRKYKKRKSLNIFGFEKIKPEVARGILVVFLFVFFILGILSMVNLAGAFGEVFAEFLRRIFGWQAYTLPLFVLILAVSIIIGQRKYKDFEVKTSNYFGVFLFILCLSGFLHLFSPKELALEIVEQGRGGGYLGFASSYPLQALMGMWGSGVILLSLSFVGLIMAFNVTLAEIVEFLAKIKNTFSKLIGFINKKALMEDELKVGGIEASAMAITKNKKQELKDEEAKSDNSGFPDLEVKSIGDNNGADVKGAKDIKPAMAVVDKNWKPYPLDLLERKSGLPTSGDINSNANIIKSTLKNFGIDVAMSEVNIGPTVTQYTFKPAEGIKLSRITALGNDLAMALAAHPLRIEAPIPGRSLVGVEVPNQTAAIVRLRDILQSEDFKKRNSNLSIILGRNVAGSPVVADLKKMPHLLIGGATGSGKSICLNTILLTMLWQNSPSSLKLILVDPKKVEMTGYNDLPHLMTPVITDVKKIVNSLRWAVSEMERRFDLFSQAGKRDIASYNSSAGDEQVPYILIVIDELADLMAVAANEVEACIVRLAQMARAVGIHLILATQRPSVNVITGLIKANITSRIAFAVASQIDSRTIIDVAGAEKLLGNGDMLYLTSDLGKPRRIQGVFVSEEEIKKVTDYLKEKGEPEYQEEVVEKQVSGTSIPGIPASDGEVDDDLYEEAKELIISAGKASASLLQRRLRVGYARAARLLDILEERKIVGPANGAKPREILVAQESVEPEQNKEENAPEKNNEDEEEEGF